MSRQEVLATVGPNITLWSARRNAADGGFFRLATKPTAGEAGAWLMHGFGWAKALDLPGFKGLLAANQGGIRWYPIAAFLPGSKVEGWGFQTAGAPMTAALAEDFNGDGVPEVVLAREDGFVNVISLAEGKMITLLNAKGPVLGLAALHGRAGRSALVVGTKLGVQAYGSDFQPLGGRALPVAAFAGPGGKSGDRVFVVEPSGAARVLVLAVDPKEKQP